MSTWLDLNSNGSLIGVTYKKKTIEFLEILSQYYKFILFSAETLNTIEPIIKVIQQKKNYFDYFFYRENNNNFIGNEYNIDLKKIGRQLNYDDSLNLLCTNRMSRMRREKFTIWSYFNQSIFLYFKYICIFFDIIIRTIVFISSK